jgi:hypothetical protein
MIQRLKLVQNYFINLNEKAAAETLTSVRFAMHLDMN